MGLFVLALKGDVDDCLNSALANIELYKDHMGDDQRRLDYLLDFIQQQIQDALVQLHK